MDPDASENVTGSDDIGPGHRREANQICPVKVAYHYASELLVQITRIREWQDWIYERTQDHITPLLNFAREVQQLCSLTAAAKNASTLIPDEWFEDPKCSSLRAVVKIAEWAVPLLVRAVDASQMVNLVRRPEDLPFDAERVNPSTIDISELRRVQTALAMHEYLTLGSKLREEERQALRVKAEREQVGLSDRSATSRLEAQATIHTSRRPEKPTPGTKAAKALSVLQAAPAGTFVPERQLGTGNPRDAIAALRVLRWPVESVREVKTRGADVPSDAKGYRLRPETQEPT